VWPTYASTAALSDVADADVRALMPAVKDRVVNRVRPAPDHGPRGLSELVSRNLNSKHGFGQFLLQQMERHCQLDHIFHQGKRHFGY
jgi:hypothetical protein